MSKSKSKSEGKPAAAHSEIPEEAAIVALLDLEPAAFARVLRKAALSGRYGIRPSAVQLLRKLVLDVAVRFGEATAVRNVKSLREIGAEGC